MAIVVCSKCGHPTTFEMGDQFACGTCGEFANAVAPKPSNTSSRVSWKLSPERAAFWSDVVRFGLLVSWFVCLAIYQLFAIEMEVAGALSAGELLVVILLTLIFFRLGTIYFLVLDQLQKRR